MAVTTAKGRKLEPGDRGKVNDTEYFVGNGNVSEDLGFPDAEERFAKLKLAAQVNEIIEKNGWTPSVISGAEFEQFVDDDFARLRATMVKSGMV